jgi:hypothetical protein
MAKSMSTSMMSSRHSRIAPAVAGLAAWGGVAVLAACSSGEGNGTDWNEVYGIVSQAFGGRSPGVTIQDAAAIPFASIGIRVGDSTEGILVLATNNPQQQLWTSASHIVLQTENGRIMRTAGLEHNRTEIHLVKGASGGPPLQGSAETQWEEDFGDLHLYSVLVTCHSVVIGPEGVPNFTSRIPTIHVDEQCHSDTIDWTFTNSYWISPKDGFTWRSIQHISPKLDPLEIELLRPPSK